MGKWPEFMMTRVRGTLVAAALVAVAGALPGPWQSPASAADPSFLVLSPSEDLAEAPSDALIAISIIDPDNVVDPASIRFYIDGEDYSSRATIAPDLVTFVPDPPLPAGRHRIEVKMRAVGGAELPGYRQEFRTAGQPVKLETERLFENKGRLTLDFLGDDLSGPGAGLRQQEDQTSTGRLDMNGRVSGWKYDLGLFLTSDEEKGFQPRNRYSLHVDHNWVGMDFGDVNYHFSEFVLQGKRTRGVGGYLRLGGTEIRALRGTINRKVAGQLGVTPATDSTLADTTVTGETWERDLVGARIEVGRGKTYQTGFDFVRVRDDVKSLQYGLNPKDNIVLGGNFLWAPFDRRVIFSADGALSALTDDISGGAITADQLDSLITGAEVPSWFNPQDWEDIYILNLSTIPLDPRSFSNVAWRGSAKGNVLGNLFEVRYQSVGPTFRSLASPSITSDKAGIRLTDTVRLLRRKLELGGEFESFSNNLKDDKEFTTDTGIFGLNATFVPGRVDVKNISAGFRRYARENDAPASDTTGARIDETTNTFRIGTGYHFYYRQGHEVTANYLYAKTDAFQAAGDAKQSDWMLNYATKFEFLPLGANLQFGVNKTEYPGQTPASEVKYTTFGLGGTYDFFDHRMESYASLVRVSGDATGGLISADKTTWNAGARYRLNARTSLAGRLSLVRFSDNTAAGMDYDENVINLRLVQDF